MPDSATGTLQDNQKKSYVASPSRAGVETAQEVFVGNSSVPVNLTSDFMLEVARGNVAGASFIHQFGEAFDIDTSDGVVDIWDGVDSALGTGKIPNYTYSTSADIDSLIAADNGDTQDIEVIGLDANFLEVTQTRTLNGQTRVALSPPLIRVFRMINRGSSDFASHIYCYVNGASTNGVPDTAADVRAIINNGNNHTLMALFTIPADKTGFLCSFFASIAENKTQNSNIDLRIRPPGEVFHTKHRSSLLAAGTSHFPHNFLIPELVTSKSDITMRSNSTVNNGSVTSGFDLILVDN